MNYGRFFEFDFESSYLQKGIAVFNYRWLKRKDSGDKKSPRYPIYLTFTPESFSFNLHLLKENKGDTANPWSHYHHTIIEIRLSSNVDVAKGLNESLNNAYGAQFPLKAKKNTGGDIKTIDDELLKIIEESFKKQDCTINSYSQLACFEPETEKDYVETAKNRTPHLLRKIILDFLYDLEFTNVFKNIVFYDELASKLKENFLFSALMNKTRYYYYRTELNAKEVVDCLLRMEPNSDIERCDRELIFHFEQYGKAETEWVNSILDHRAMSVFHESPWFDEAYEELEQVYFAQPSGKWKPNDEHSRLTIPPVPQVGKVKPVGVGSNKTDTRVRYLKRISADKDPFKLSVSNLLNLVRKRSPQLWKVDDKTSFGRAVNMHSETAKKAAAWEVGHFHFVGLWKLWFGDVSTFVWSALCILPILIPAIVVGIISFANKQYCYYCDVSRNEFGYNCIASNTPQDWNFVVILSVLFVLFLMMSWVMRLHFRSTWGEGGMALLMPRLLAAVTTAWFTITMSVDAIQVFTPRLDHYRWPAIVILALITLVFEMYEARLKNPYDKWYVCLTSSIVVYAFAFAYSILVGCLSFEFFGPSTIDETIIRPLLESAKQGDIDSHKINLYPVKFVVQFSFFTSFIGIFLQLMFQGKSVTDTK